MDDITARILMIVIAAVGSVIAVVVPRWAEVSERRRTCYAEAVQCLASWAEYVYRIARRVDNKPETLKEITAQGHALQERLAFYKAWIYAESKKMGQMYSQAVNKLKSLVGPAMQEAWKRQPAGHSSLMNIGTLGIAQDQVGDLIERVVKASNTRFGWRRLWPFISNKIYELEPEQKNQ